MTWRGALSLGGLAALALSIGAMLMMRRDGGLEPRLVLLYAPCTVNRAFLSPYDAAIPFTPHLAAFARDGLVFMKHHTESGLSGVAYAALLSGTQAMQHGVYHQPTPLDDRVYEISEAFRDHGYDVFFWADQDMASPELNYGQGVDPGRTFWEPRRGRARADQSGAFLRADDPAFRTVLSRLRENPGYKAFLLTTFSVTHTPYSDLHVGEFCRTYAARCAGLSEAEIRRYTALFLEYNFHWQHAFDTVVAMLQLSPEEVAKVIRVAGLLYESNVFHLDRSFGDVVRAIDEHGLGDETLISFTADHGERMYREGASDHWTHGFELAHDDIVVPWILRGAGVRPGRYEAVTRSIDVFPTMAGLSGVSLPSDTVRGVDLSAAVRGTAPAPELIAFSHTALLPDVAPTEWLPRLAARFPRNVPAEMWVAARRGDLIYKLTSPDGSGFRPHVYDWKRDPGETDDLYDPADETHRAMVDRLGEYKNELVQGFERTPSDVPRGSLTERQREQLRALGYIH